VSSEKGLFMADIFHNSMEEYLSIEGEIKLEYWGGLIRTRGGPPAILLGGIVEKKPEEAYLVMINNASREEVEKLAEFIDAMRKKA
jgi:hypothetical protein